MSKQIQIVTNQDLILNNVIKKELRNVSYKKMDEEIIEFHKALASYHANLYGPLIIHTLGAHILHGDIITVDIDIMSQGYLYDYSDKAFIIEKEHRCKNCLYAHYEGDTEHMQMVFNKLDIYIYEHDFKETGRSYSLYFNSSSGVRLDVYKQIE